MGNASTIKSGDIQVMSAGTGILHSEFNPNHDQHTKLFQIWLFPKYHNVTPRYQQITLDQAVQKIILLKFYLQIQKMLVFGFIKMLGFI